MKRNRKRQRSSKKGSGTRPPRQDLGTTGSAGLRFGRRGFLTQLRNWGVVGLVVGAVGWYMIDEVTATIAEHDLSRIGNGVPSIVQVHDPQCAHCRALQRETRKALREFDDSALQYLVANIRTDMGRDFAAAHTVGHVTLVLLDGQGKRRSIVRVRHQADMLGTLFRAHLDESTAK